MYTKAARHMRLTVSFPGLVLSSWVSWYQKSKTSLNLNEARDNGILGWQWHRLDHMQTICTSIQTDNHTNTSTVNTQFLQAGYTFWRPTKCQSTGGTSKYWRHKALKALESKAATKWITLQNYYFCDNQKEKAIPKKACSKYTCDDNMQVLDKFYDCNRNTHIYW